MRYSKFAAFGHLLMSFNNCIKGFLTIIIAPLFFPQKLPEFQLLMSYIVYAAIFITGPLGAIVCGRFGDKFGRRKVLLFSRSVSSLVFIAIGLLPVYQDVGILAPLCLTFLSLVFGLFVSAEYTGSLIYNYEEGYKEASSSSGIISFGFQGGALAAVVCFLVTQSWAPVWFWRIPFLIGGMSGLILFVLTIYTPEPIEYFSRSKNIEFAFKILFKKYKLEIITAATISAAYSSTCYSAMVFGNRLFQQAGFSISQTMIFYFVNVVFFAVFVKHVGIISDKVGDTTQLKMSIIVLVILILPICYLISGSLSLFKIYLYMIILSTLSASIVSCASSYILRLFPVSFRYSGFAISESIGNVLGGITPFMMLLISSLFKTNLACSMWLYATSIPTLFMVTMMSKKTPNNV